MKRTYEYLKDSTFLKEVDNLKLKEQFVKITVLDWLENPIQDVEGIVTGGSINVNGTSSMRRTCNITFFINEDEYVRLTNLENLISLNKKIRLEIGYKNITNRYTQYDKIWYPQGVYVIMNPSISRSSNGATVSVSLKDKICLLNGECGGTIPASTQFDEYETIDENGNWIIEKPVIHQIIRECVNHFGGEQLGKIIISDIDTRIKKVMKWIGSSPVFLVRGINDSYSMTTNETFAVSQVDPNDQDKVRRFEYGDDVGFIYTDFYYPDELIANAGDSVCTILDKIKNVLGNFEYFYDVDGNFHFQEIKNYLNTTHAKVEIDKLNKDDYIVDMSNGKTVYQFDNSNLVTSFSNTPRYDMIKNDFVVWGIRKNANGNDVPIRYHLAIDSKPKIGNTYKCFFYTDPDDNLIKAKVPIMFDTYENMIANQGAAGVFYMTKSDGVIYKWDDGQYIPIKIGLTDVTTKDWRTELYLQGVQSEPLAVESNYYYTELLNEWPKLYDVEAGAFYPEVLKTPSDIDFYLDFIDSNAAISKFSISNIGRRTKIITDNDINCIFEPDTANLPVIIEAGQEDTDEKRAECEEKGQFYVQVESSIFEMLTGGGNHNSAYNAIRQSLHEFTSYNESITIQAIPVYYLEPNTRIEVRDIESNIFGDYMMSTISLPLGVEGTMSISATRALEKF